MRKSTSKVMVGVAVVVVVFVAGMAKRVNFPDLFMINFIHV
jgi:hypothetical protein